MTKERKGIALTVLQAAMQKMAADEAPRRTVKAPELPPGVVPKNTDVGDDPAGLGPYLALDSQDVAPLYSYANQFMCGLGFPGYPYLAELAQLSEYQSPVTTIANEMTRKWLKIVSRGKGDKGDKIAKLEAAMRAFKVRKHVRKLILHDGFYGRAQLYVSIDGQIDDRSRQLPLVIDPKSIEKGSLLGFQPIEPLWTTPYTYNSLDPTLPDFYKPKAWYVLGKKTHHTRLLTIVSREVPDLLKPAYNFGGLSISQLIEPYVNRWRKTVGSVNDLIRNFSITALKTDMAATLGGDASDDIFKRAQLFNATRDNRGLMMLDFTSEDLVNISTPLSGLAELQAQAQEHMAGPTHIPLVKLFGITPTGLNASSEGEIKVFYDFINAEQGAVIDETIEQILNILQCNEFGDIDPDIGHEWVSLDALTVKELAEVRKANAEEAATYIDKGVIDPDEQRERLMQDPESGYNNLTGAAPGPPDMGEEDAGDGPPPPKKD